MVCLAAFFDTFIGTGYLLYGFALLATVGMMHMDGLVTIPEIMVAASIGTIAASSTNFALGRWFGHTTWVQHRLNTKPIRTLQGLLNRYGNWWFIIIGRSVTFFRPSYALLLGLMERPWRKFLVMEIPFAILWVSFWLGIIIFGELLYQAVLG
jgi:membrane protein DedA with SNARE-associated domain